MTLKKEQAEIFNYPISIVSDAIQDTLEGREKTYGASRNCVGSRS